MRKTKHNDNLPLFILNIESTADVATSTGFWDLRISLFAVKVKPGLGFSESDPEILHLSDLGPVSTASQISSSGTKPELDTCLPLLQTKVIYMLNYHLLDSFDLYSNPSSINGY
ncbi:hypothetical protein VNO77_15985 [Canavalia gladiata]|uniref:Uncharacterized protein n=1 Tax=Canavalia gladiata TaxID=3824 RepID=A0AAN9QSP6_CANGL